MKFLILAALVSFAPLAHAADLEAAAGICIIESSCMNHAAANFDDNTDADYLLRVDQDQVSKKEPFIGLKSTVFCKDAVLGPTLYFAYDATGASGPASPSNRAAVAAKAAYGKILAQANYLLPKGSCQSLIDNSEFAK